MITFYLGHAAPAEGERCSRRDFLEGDDIEEESRRVLETRTETSPDRMAGERPQGSRDRSSARMITGSVARISCAQNQRCDEQEMCRSRPTPSMAISFSIELLNVAISILQPNVKC